MTSVGVIIGLLCSKIKKRVGLIFNQFESTFESIEPQRVLVSRYVYTGHDYTTKGYF
jgi:hypothetical protein